MNFAVSRNFNDMLTLIEYTLENDVKSDPQHLIISTLPISKWVSVSLKRWNEDLHISHNAFQQFKKMVR